MIDPSPLQEDRAAPAAPPTTLQTAGLILAAIAMIGGPLGMVLSFTYMASASPANIVCGAAGFVAGSILAGSGLISLAAIASRR